MKSRGRLPRAVILLLFLIVPAAVIAYYLHNPAWLIGFPIAIFALMGAVAFVFSTLDLLFGVGRRKGTPEEFADALECHLLGKEPVRGWDEPMDVALADPQREAVRRRLGHSLHSLSREEGGAELRCIIAALRRGDLPEGPKCGIMRLFHFRR